MKVIPWEMFFNWDKKTTKRLQNSICFSTTCMSSRIRICYWGCRGRLKASEPGDWVSPAQPSESSDWERTYTPSTVSVDLWLKCSHLGLVHYIHKSTLSRPFFCDRYKVMPPTKLFSYAFNFLLNEYSYPRALPTAPHPSLFTSSKTNEHWIFSSSSFTD